MAPLADLWRWYTADTSDPREVEVVKWALVNAAVFYAIAVVVFFAARKTRLNLALAIQKALWLVVIVGMTLPVYWHFASMPAAELRAMTEAAADRPGQAWLPVRVRITVWTALSVTSWWVLVEVWRVNFGRRREGRA